MFLDRANKALASLPSHVSAFLTRALSVETLLFAGIYVSFVVMCRDFTILQESNVHLGAMVIKVMEELQDVKQFSALSLVISFFTMVLAGLIGATLGGFTAWNVYEPMFYDHPQFTLCVVVVSLFLGYFVLLLPIYVKIVYGFCQQYPRMVISAMLIALYPFGFAHCMDLDMAPALDASPTPSRASSPGLGGGPLLTDAVDMTAAPGVPGGTPGVPGGVTGAGPPNSASGRFLEWLLELCAQLGITVSAGVLAALKNFLAAMYWGALWGVRLGTTGVVCWWLFKWGLTSKDATVIHEFFQSLVDALRKGSDQLGTLIEIHQKMDQAIEELNEGHDASRGIYFILSILVTWLKSKGK